MHEISKHVFWKKVRININLLSVELAKIEMKVKDYIAYLYFLHHKIFLSMILYLMNFSSAAICVRMGEFISIRQVVPSFLVGTMNLTVMLSISRAI